MTRWTSNVRPAYLEALHYISAKDLVISLNPDTYATIFSADTESVLHIFKEETQAANWDLVFPILWNELDHNWDRTSPYLVSEKGWSGMKKYMTLQTERGIAGPVSIIFSLLPSPNAILCIERGSPSGRNVRHCIELWDGVPAVRLHMPTGFGEFAAVKQLERDWDALNVDIGRPGMFPAIDRLHLRREPGGVPRSQHEQQIDRLTLEDLEDAAYAECLSSVLFSLGYRDRSSMGKVLPKVHSSLALSWLLLGDVGGAIVYCFRSFGVPVEGSESRALVRAGGGCLVFLGSAIEESLTRLYLLTSVVVSRASAAQQYFRQHSERRHALRAAYGSVVARNMSHNLGSHVVAGLTWGKLRRYAGWEGRSVEEGGRQVELFLNYMQQRMDLVARIATDWPRWREPVLFVRDLIFSFMQQRILLDRLASDVKVGYPVTAGVSGGDDGILPMKFCVNTPDMEQDSFVDVNEEALESIPDVLISLPGGVAGRQAYYGFLENAIRNAAKHGSRDGKGLLRVYLRVIDGAGGWLSGADQVQPVGGSTGAASKEFTFVYADNLSDRPIQDEDGKHRDPWIVMQRKIRQPLIDYETGIVTKRDWGIQEMKVYASFLSYDESRDRGEPEPGEKALTARKFVRPGDGAGVLAYQFQMFRANLIAVGGEESAPQGEEQLRRWGICRLNGDLTDAAALPQLLARIQELSPGLLYLKLPGGEVERDRVFKWIAESQSQLPARIMLSTPLTEDLSVVESSLREQHLSGRCFAIHALVDGTDGFPWPAPGRAEPAQKLVIQLRRLWLEKFARSAIGNTPDHGDKLQLVIYADRPEPTGLEAWKRLRSAVEDFGLQSLVQAYLLYQGDRTVTHVQPWEPTAIGASRCHTFENMKGAICFDNHSRLSLRGLDRNGAAFWHVIAHRAGEDNDGRTTSDELYSYNASVFDRIMHCATGFPGVISLLELLEACLLRVLVVDERIAELFYRQRSEGTIEQQHPIALKDFRDARVDAIPIIEIDSVMIPILPFRGELRDGGGIPAIVIDTGGKVGDDVGVTLRNCRSAQVVCKEGAMPPFDVVIIHWRQLEVLSKQCELTTILRALRRVGGRVIITSGRGAPREKPLSGYPFLEYSALEACLVRELDKLQLGGILMALLGG